MPINYLAGMTWEEVRDLEGAGTVAVLPIGAIEAHGPHLPLATDVIISDAMAHRGAEKLAARGLDVLILPPLVYTAAGFAAGFPGTISLAPDDVTRAITAIARSLARHGITTLALANSHLDPEHIAALEDAVQSIEQDGLLTTVFPDVTKKPWALRLTDEFKSGACHAGRYEGSMIMALRPELVREELRSDLPAVPSSLSEAIGKGLKSFEEAGGDRAYFGYPADASREEGEQTIELLGLILEEAVLDATRG
jgi:creatinine amidohydrolase